jgi:hypothetical protein
MEGALFGAAALRMMGFKPLLLDLEAVVDDDHVIAIFRQGACWGAVAKSNYSGLRFREPVYRLPRSRRRNGQPEDLRAVSRAGLPEPARAGHVVFRALMRCAARFGRPAAHAWRDQAQAMASVHSGTGNRSGSRDDLERNRSHQRTADLWI